jgi:hypothetical protein
MPMPARTLKTFLRFMLLTTHTTGQSPSIESVRTNNRVQLFLGTLQILLTGSASFSLTRSEEVLAVIAGGHVPMYCDQPEGIWLSALRAPKGSYGLALQMLETVTSGAILTGLLGVLLFVPLIASTEGGRR